MHALCHLPALADSLDPFASRHPDKCHIRLSGQLTMTSEQVPVLVDYTSEKVRSVCFTSIKTMESPIPLFLSASWNEKVCVFVDKTNKQ